MGETSIEWADYTFNPWWGCEQISPGCKHCYAKTFAARVGHGKRLPMLWGPETVAARRFFGDAHWEKPLAWNVKAERRRRRARVFSGSMCDVFEDRPELWTPRRRLARLVERTPALDWLLLTKRPENMVAMGREMWGAGDWPRNVWAGCTVENQQCADARIPALLRVPARVRFVSCEPLLEHVTLKLSEWGSCFHEGYEDRDHEADHRECASHLDWVIVGGESGPGARPFDLAWARSIREQCEKGGVACFVKQLGSRPEMSPGPVSWPASDPKGGDWNEWPDDLRVRHYPEARP